MLLSVYIWFDHKAGLNVSRICPALQEVFPTSFVQIPMSDIVVRTL